VRAIILAAGRGSRMKNLTEDRPKCLVELRGKALLDRQVETLRAAGIAEIAIVTGYKRELLSQRGLVEFHNERWAETNMVSSLSCAESWLRDGPCIVSYSDIFYEVSAIQSLMTCNALLAVTYDPNWLDLWTRRFGDPLLDAETFRLNPDQTVAEIGNKPTSLDKIQGQYMGLLRFTPEGWTEMVRIRLGLMSDQSDNIQMTNILQRIIDAGLVAIMAVPYAEAWGEIDSLEDLTKYNP
jgi:choline kinase